MKFFFICVIFWTFQSFGQNQNKTFLVQYDTAVKHRYNLVYNELTEESKSYIREKDSVQKEILRKKDSMGFGNRSILGYSIFTHYKDLVNNKTFIGDGSVGEPVFSFSALQGDSLQIVLGPLLPNYHIIVQGKRLLQCTYNAWSKHDPIFKIKASDTASEDLNLNCIVDKIVLSTQYPKVGDVLYGEMDLLMPTHYENNKQKKYSLKLVFKLIVNSELDW
jgi:hypothetical protein